MRNIIIVLLVISGFACRSIPREESWEGMRDGHLRVVGNIESYAISDEMTQKEYDDYLRKVINERGEMLLNAYCSRKISDLQVRQKCIRLIPDSLKKYKIIYIREEEYSLIIIGEFDITDFEKNIAALNGVEGPAR